MITLYFLEKKNYVMIWLICDSLPFYAHAYTCSPSRLRLLGADV